MLTAFHSFGFFFKAIIVTSLNPGEVAPTQYLYEVAWGIS
jgi:hypothetical protein